MLILNQQAPFDSTLIKPLATSPQKFFMTDEGKSISQENKTEKLVRTNETNTSKLDGGKSPSKSSYTYNTYNNENYSIDNDNDSFI